MKKKSRETLIKEFRDIHGDRYDYAAMDYEGCHRKVKVVCKEHGLFLIAPHHHLRGSGCRKCYRSIWTNKDKKTLRENYYLGVDFCCKLLSRSEKAIAIQAAKMKISKPTPKFVKIEYEPFEEISRRYMSNLYNNAKKRGIQCFIFSKDIWMKFLEQEKKCALTGRPISFQKNLQTASVDRIDSSKGYIAENIQIVHKEVNKLKMNLTEEELYKICEEIIAYRNQSFTKDTLS